MKIAALLFCVISTLFADQVDVVSFLESPQEYVHSGELNYKEITNFTLELQSSLESKYGLKIDIVEAIKLSRDAILSHPEFTRDEKTQLLSVLDTLFEEQRAVSCGFKWFWENKKDKEFILPDRMASGFVCILGGSLLSIIPGCQPYGLTAIGAGIGLLFEGMAQGERPYYVDAKTGRRITAPR